MNRETNDRKTITKCKINLVLFYIIILVKCLLPELFVFVGNNNLHLNIFCLNIKKSFYMG